MKRIFILVVIAIVFAACTRYFTPYEAANTGGKHCNKRNVIR